MMYKLGFFVAGVALFALGFCVTRAFLARRARQQRLIEYMARRRVAVRVGGDEGKDGGR
ncbi:hypothetical protein [Synergistes jonesii]|uniref:hypothetical protein n=1 Tax=Synergistes jonesii TaxID=2754 RepID=UPI00248D507E|nr:hypothetical protein [Synergistes jonesii]